MFRRSRYFVSLLGFQLAMAACSPDASSTDDGGLDATSDTPLTILQIEPAILTCNTAEYHLDVLKQHRISGLPASAFELALYDGHGVPIARPEECFAEVTTDDASADGYYRFCYSGLDVGAATLLTVTVHAASESATSTFEGTTLHCDAGVSDAASESSVSDASSPDVTGEMDATTGD